MPHPDKDSDPSEKAGRRPSHFRKKKRKDATTKVVRVLGERLPQESDASHIVRSPRVQQEEWSSVINPAPLLPDPLLHRPTPSPAPLPSETATDDPTVPGSLDDRQRRKRAEDIIGTVALALMVTAMLVAMWLRMTGP